MWIMRMYYFHEIFFLLEKNNIIISYFSLQKVQQMDVYNTKLDWPEESKHLILIALELLNSI